MYLFILKTAEVLGSGRTIYNYEIVSITITFTISFQMTLEAYL